MSETPRDQRDLWHEVSRTFEELGEALRVHLSPDAARSPSDPTHPSEGRAGGPADRVETELAPWADPARPGQADDDPWAAATDRPGRGAAGESGPTDPTTSGPATGPTATAARGTTTTAAGGSPTDPSATASGADATGAAATGPGSTSADATAAGRSGPGTTGTGAAGTGTNGSGTSGTSATGTAGTGTSGTGTGGKDAGGAGGGRGRGWREWSGTADGGRFGGADWESARESVRDLGSSVRRIATQAGDAARDPHVRDSAQRAARSLGDAIVTTVEELATELRGRMRNPRWSDTSRAPEPPPVAPIEDNRDDKP